MANMQPMGRDKSTGLSDVTYDLVTVLANCGEAIEALSEYIEDAKRDNNPNVQQCFEQIRNDELRHCEILRTVISDQAKQGKF
jgi:hypothetical protein